MIPTRQQVEQALQQPSVRAMLHVIREGETNQSDDAYRMMNGGALFDSFAAHPFAGQSAPPGKACGAYQFIPHTWERVQQMFPDVLTQFTPAMQDFGAVVLLFLHDCVDEITAGNLDAAIAALGREWVSLPALGARAHRVFAQYSGAVGTQPAAPIEDRSTTIEENKPMGALMFLPAILQMVPALIGLFGKGDRAQVNAKAAQLVVDTFTQAVPGAVNAQDAIEKAQADPAVRAAAVQAVMTQPVIEQMLSVGPTDMKEARAQNVTLVQSASKWWQLVFNPVLIVTVLTLPLVYMFVYGLTFGATTSGLLSKVSADVIAQTMGTVIGLVLGGIMGFWMGQTYNQTNRRSTDSGTTAKE
jgi:muramidase (phage lysozyme)